VRGRTYDTGRYCAKKVETPASYVNKLIRRDEGVVNNTYVKMLEALGYDIELHYVKREE
jgi:hypothetical protein